MLINVKMQTIVGILTFMSRINFVLSCIEHEKYFITLGPGYFALYFMYLTFCCRVAVSFLCLFLMVLWDVLQCVIVVFPDHTHLHLDL